MSDQVLTIIGGGLAGCEAAWQAAKRGCRVMLYDMKPQRFSPAHSSPDLAELVCSNSFRSNDPFSAVGLLKEEMRGFDSLVMAAAAETRVPAGRALAVDRARFASFITEKLASQPAIAVCREEITELPPASTTGNLTILATGPLTSDSLARSLQEITGNHLSFYDAIAPIVVADSLDRTVIYQASRYDEGPGDYLNCPFDKDQYRTFIAALAEADKVELKPFEEKKYFEGCLPIEVMLERGDDTLRFGPMKPVGLPDPRTGRDPYAVVQLRKENLEASHYNMVGFQTKLTYPEQKRVFRLIPGMENAEFERLGSIHRNTFVCAPEVLAPSLQLKKRHDILLAGQITGVEGYVESTAMGLLAGINAARLLSGKEPLQPPADTALGALIHHLTETDSRHFQPSNINFGLFPELPTEGKRKVAKKMRGRLRAERALQSLQSWRENLHEG
ncbi:MAG: methylenetetrahydrofolate--tRNA-(uracil(54)-C(5))-methyltransferase (FADH(2)-oxidizing) TrmFO [Desulfobulbaceae bacterium DB1]|nr:MAG: methylenetetrahydrofolate--tRNA-(uracil(54)-C(5))-methyltransferase (FADH(2)-oxidizing) TrmFO [Desulfobulbaceae bacterium DB1]